ncbi:Regulator of spindle pole body duplication [Phytophthora cinnamomi]|uniref:Regulator of spindle pole body duplication n=1 Tax=Phytophthora cinnamomi TaxID=4785 RepID=UPI00355988ED|nr:Regulator of spindle pole body duplication [Phytophthora cinnamomi]
MRGKVEDGTSASRAQLLALLQRRGQARKALVLFVPEASTCARNAGAPATSSVVLKLLNAAVERRRPEWTQALAVERDPKRQRVSGSSKSDVVFSAKLAQSVVKTYAASSAAAAKEEEMEDLVAAMDLACVALYVACALEHAVRLGDLVVDNLLYQVAKKYAEIPSMREAASCVAACVHIRLWSAHAKLCKASGGGTEEKSQLMVLLDRKDGLDLGVATRVTQKLGLVAEFPEPMNYHADQFTRLLLGHVNTCVTLLVAGKNHEAVLKLADSTLSLWIDHLGRLPGQNSKLASSFSDRTFRILWKCAAAADGAKQKSAETAASTALRFRSTALTFLLKCSNYTTSYFIQQVHRVGVLHERVSKRSRLGLREVYTFYAREANALALVVPDATHLYTSELLQWEYVYWLEHFASICDLHGWHLKSAVIMESAAQYVQLFGSTGTPIHVCVLFSISDHVLFLSRCLKRNSTKVFNYAISVQHSSKHQLYRQVITCFGNMCKAVKELRSSATNAKVFETLVLEESRLHRMAVILSVKCCEAGSSPASNSALHAISEHEFLVT